MDESVFQCCGKGTSVQHDLQNISKRFLENCQKTAKNILSNHILFCFNLEIDRAYSVNFPKMP